MPRCEKWSTTPTTLWPGLFRNLRQRLQLDLAEAQLQCVAGDVEEIIGRVREGHVELAAVCGPPAKLLSIQCFFPRARAILGGIDERDLAFDRSRDRISEQWIMRTSKH